VHLILSRLGDYHEDEGSKRAFVACGVEVIQEIGLLIYDGKSERKVMLSSL